MKNVFIASMFFFFFQLTFSSNLSSLEIEKDSSLLANKNFYISSAIAVGSCFLIDEYVYEFSQNNQNVYADTYFEVMDPFGGRIVPTSLSISMFLGGKLFSNHELRETSLTAMKALVYSGITTSTIKTITGRARPYVNGDHTDFRPINIELKESYHSFPSGHSTAAWSFITPYAENYHKALYLIPLSVSMSRIYKNKHWLSDVVAGGILGYVSAKYLNQKF